jgi:hypothetical protein
LVAAYFEADRISMTELLRRRELSQGYDKSRVFDLRTISSGVRQPVPSGELIERPKNGQVMNGGAAGIVASGSAGSAAKTRVLMGDHVPNGNVTPHVTQSANCSVPKSKPAVGDNGRSDQQPSSFRLIRRFFGSDTGKSSNGVGPDSIAASSSAKDARSFTDASRTAESNNGKGRNSSQSLFRFARIPFGAVGYAKAAIAAAWRFSKTVLPSPDPSTKLAKEDASASTAVTSSGGTCGNNIAHSASVELLFTGSGKSAADTRSNTQPRKADKLAVSGTLASDDAANSKCKFSVSYS